MTASTDPPRSPLLACALNVVLPGAGNIYFGQRVAGVALMALLLLSGFIFSIETSAVAMGIILLIAGVILAIFTIGASLIIAGPVGIIFLVMKTGPALIVLTYVSTLMAAQFLVFARANKAASVRSSGYARGSRHPAAKPRTD